MNEPPAFAVSAAGTVATTFPLIWITIGELATYPVPMICTVLPVLVVVGVKVITGIVNVNVALATFPECISYGEVVCRGCGQWNT